MIIPNIGQPLLAYLAIFDHTNSVLLLAKRDRLQLLVQYAIHVLAGAK